MHDTTTADAGRTSATDPQVAAAAAAPLPRSLALIATGRSGWGSIRGRWERHLPAALPGCEVRSLHLEDHARAVGWASRRSGRCDSLWTASAGRAAGLAAIRAGCEASLVATIHFAPWLPLVRGHRWLIYADATPAQLARLYDGSGLGVVAPLYRRLARIAADGHRFLAMSRWCADGLRAEFGVPDDRIHLLPPFVDTMTWTPEPRPEPTPDLRIAFVGSDGRRKGLDVVLAVAALPEFRGCRWEIVSGEVRPPQAGVVFHGAFPPDGDGLRRLVAGCDLLALPTRADCSSLVTVEAGACAVPAIATAVGGIPDLIDDGVHGSLLREPTVEALAAALRAYRQCPALARERGLRMRERVERRFSLAAHVGAVVAVLRAR